MDWIDISLHFLRQPLTVFLIFLALAVSVSMVMAGVITWRRVLRPGEAGAGIQKAMFVNTASGELRATEVNPGHGSNQGVRVNGLIAFIFATVASVLYIFTVPFLGFYMVGKFIVSRILSFPRLQERR